MLELLIVIGILAILATATVLVLNPAELLKQARDSQRITDIASLNSTLGLFITSVTGNNLVMATGSVTINDKCKGGGVNDTDFTCFSDRQGAPTATCYGRYTTAVSATSAVRKINSTGWLPVDFTAIPGGSPIPNLPTDPSNSASTTYAYACKSDLTYVLTTGFESTKYGPTGDDLAAKDGGPSNIIYEIGTTPSLSL